MSVPHWKCLTCGTTNSTDSKYCIRCGKESSAFCYKCGAKNQLSFRFCGSCGTDQLEQVVERAGAAEKKSDFIAAIKLWGTVLNAEPTHETAQERIDRLSKLNDQESDSLTTLEKAITEDQTEQVLDMWNEQSVFRNTTKRLKKWYRNWGSRFMGNRLSAAFAAIKQRRFPEALDSFKDFYRFDRIDAEKQRLSFFGTKRVNTLITYALPCLAGLICFIGTFNDDDWIGGGIVLALLMPFLISVLNPNLLCNVIAPSIIILFTLIGALITNELSRLPMVVRFLFLFGMVGAMGLWGFIVSSLIGAIQGRLYALAICRSRFLRKAVAIACVVLVVIVLSPCDPVRYSVMVTFIVMLITLTSFIYPSILWNILLAECVILLFILFIDVYEYIDRGFKKFQEYDFGDVIGLRIIVYLSAVVACLVAYFIQLKLKYLPDNPLITCIPSLKGGIFERVKGHGLVDRRG